MLIPAFQIQLNQTVLKGKVIVGKYDGKHPCLTCATNAGKIFLHNPHEKDFEEDQIKFLNINRKVTSLSCGGLNPKNKDYDILLVGTSTNLLGYDVEKNSDIFYQEVSDGLNCMAFGTIAKTPLAIVGGNCAIQGFDYEGKEQYWTTTGGNVTSLVLIDVDEDGEPELLVGSDDYNIYIYRNEEHFSEVTENDSIVQLCDMRLTKYGYALENGTVGLYDKEKRIWKKKRKHKINSMKGFDLDGDGIPELITGWNNGSIDVRNEKNGSIIFKDSFNSPISGIVKSDYRLDGKEEIICCSYSGEVRGFLSADQQMKLKTSKINKQTQEKALEELQKRKNELLVELNNYEDNINKIRKHEYDPNLLNPKTKVNCRLIPNHKKNCVDIVFTTNDEKNAYITAAIITAEQLFENESDIIYSKEPSHQLSVSLRPEKDIVIDMNIKVLVGHAMAEKYHVFELFYTMPKFSTWVPVVSFNNNNNNNENNNFIKSNVKFKFPEMKNKIVKWLNFSFNILYGQDKSKPIDIKFKCLRNDEKLEIKLDDDTKEMTIYGEKMETVGEIVQDICAFLKITELETEANFPEEIEKLKTLLEKVEQFNKSRLKMMAEMADSSQIVKSLVIRAEDARLLGQMKTMRNAYSELYNLNKDLIGEYIKRSNNQQQLLSALKQVNQIIQNASKLRVGKSKSSLVSKARKAVKKNNIPSLFEIIKFG